MFGFGSSSPAKGSDVHRAQQLVQDDNEEQDLAGVGIVFVRAPDDSLFVKSIIDGSGAQNSGIQVGDCLMKVEGKNVYCRGIEFATKLILGPVGTAVRLKFGRIDRGGKRHVYSQMLVRELKATSAPQWQINSANSMIEGITTSQLYLECMQNGSGSGSLTNSGENSLVATISRSMDAQARVGSRASNTTSEDSSSYVSADGFENDDGMGVFGRGGFGGGSSCSSSSASRASKEEAAGDEGTGEARKPKKQRKILFKGKWYTEEQISEMERVARSLTDKIDETLEQKNKATKKGEKKSAPESTSAAAGSAVSKAKDGGFKPKESVDQSPEALSAAIFVVHGGNLTKTSKSKLGGESRNVLVKMSTGGMITWGSKTAHAMRAFVQKDAYDPKMSKAQYRDMDCKFAVVLEGDKFFAHSNDGGTVRAVEGRVLEFIAGSPEDCKKWVLGITAVLDMMKREAASRAAKARVIESAPSDARVKSVFITRPMATAPAGDFAQHRSNSLPSLQSRAHVASSSSAVSERDVAPVAESRHPPSVAVAAARDSESPPLTAVSSSQASNVSTESSGRPDDGRAGRIDVLRFLEEGKERENAGLAASISRGGGVDIGHIVEDEAGSRDAHECQEETNGRAERRKAVEEEMKKEEERKRSAKGKEEREAENRRAVEEKKEEEERKRSAKEKEEREAENRRAVEEKKEEERKRPAKEKEEREAERKKQEEGLGARDGGSKEEGIHAKSDVTAPRQSNVNAVTCDDSGKGDGKIPGLAKALKPAKFTVTREAPEPSEIDKAIALKPAAKKDRVSDETRLAVQKNVVMAARAGTDDLASLLAARKKKQQEAEENEDGYYFD